jgi:hypothetical protein
MNTDSLRLQLCRPAPLIIKLEVVALHGALLEYSRPADLALIM